jgi:heat shock protein HtpX
MTAVMVLVSTIAGFFCKIYGVDLRSSKYIYLLFYFTLLGFGGSFISLFLSKYFVKKMMNVRVITHPMNQQETWLVETIRLLAIKKGVNTPEVGIYNSPELNAFATGSSKNNSLVAVSTGLLNSMEQDEIEAVLGHEMSHVANGDMVTQCLLQGIVNTFVYAFAYIIALMATPKRSKNLIDNNLVFYSTKSFLQIIFGIFGSIIVLWFSRIREYRADAGSADIFGNQAMIKALIALKSQKVLPKPDGVKALCIAGVQNFSELFMTHPPIDKRIKALQKRIK